MSLFGSISQLSRGQLVSLSAVLGTLCVFPYVALPVRLARSYMKVKSKLVLQLLCVSVLLLPGGLDSFVAGVQEAVCYATGGHAMTAVVGGVVMSCTYTWPWRQAVLWTCEAAASLTFMMVTIDRHGMLADHQLIWLPVAMRRALKGLLFFLFAMFLVLLILRSNLPPDLQAALAVPVFGTCGLIDMSLALATLRTTFKLRRQLLEDDNRVQETPAMTDTNYASTKDPLPVAKSSKQLISERTRLLVTLAALQLAGILVYAVVMIARQPALSLAWVIGTIQVPTFLLRVHFAISILYLRLLAGLAADGAQRAKQKPETTIMSGW